MIGETCALLAALTWAFALVLFKLSVEDVPPIALNLFKNVVALLFFGITLLILTDDGRDLARYTRGDFGILLLSGILGIAAADTLFFRSLDLIGVGITVVVDCLYSPFVILFAHLLLSETLAPHQYVGTALIVGAVLLSTGHVPPAGRTRGQLVYGIVLGVSSMAVMTFGIVIAKPVLDGRDFPLIWATAIRLVAGALALAILALVSPRRNAYWAVFRPSRIWKFSVPASFLGAYLAMIFWVAGFKYAKASIAGILNQTSIIFAVILATLILKEEMTRRKLVAVITATLGVVVVSM